MYIFFFLVIFLINVCTIIASSGLTNLQMVSSIVCLVICVLFIVIILLRGEDKFTTAAITISSYVCMVLWIIIVAFDIKSITGVDDKLIYVAFSCFNVIAWSTLFLKVIKLYFVKTNKVAPV